MSQEAQEAKEKGNSAFSKGNYKEAVDWFSEAIAYDPQNHILFSNRSAAWTSLGKYEEALTDAEKAISLSPKWPRGYGRKAVALHYLQRFDDAVIAYQKGLEVDPNNEQFKNGIKDAQAAKASQYAGGAGSSGNPLAEVFSGDIWPKLNAHPITASYKNNPETVQLLESIRKNPTQINQFLSDERVMNAMAVLLNIPLQQQEPPKKEEPASKPQKPSEAPKPETPSEKVEAEKEKELGNQEYKKKNWEAALAHYNRAIELYPDEVAYYSNIAAVYLEKGDYEECIKQCEKAMEEAKRLQVYSFYARLLARMGNAYFKMEKWDDAIRCYNKSLTEHRTPDTLNRLQKAEKAKKEAEERAYLDPEISLQEKAKGNEFFAKQDFPEAVKCYTEAIRRNPKDHILYSNRCACLQKLGEFPSALKDAEKCIELCPTFVKGYSRKAICHFFMKEYHKAMAAYDQGLKIDPNNSECLEGLQKVERAVMSNQGKDKPDQDQINHAMADPEIQSILTDPVMRQVLTDMQSDSMAAQKHMRNPDISRKIQKLVAAGVIRMG